MKVILRADIEGVGERGDLLDVAKGFARNYLLPKQLAIQASRGAERQATAMRRTRDIKTARERSTAEELARKLVPTVITIPVNAGSGGRLFGSVTAGDIVQAVAAQSGVELDRRRLQLAEPIRSVGVHQVLAKLHAEVEFPITVELVAEER